MIRAIRQSTGLLRHVCLTLATLAIMLKVLIPAGFMAASTNDLPFALVICTGQGAVSMAPEQALAGHHQTPADKPGHDSPCAFAGHGAAAAAPNLLDAAAVEFVAWRQADRQPLIDLAPGRGLAAPPLPARGPPTLLT